MSGHIEYGDACFITAVGGRSVPAPILRKAASRYETKLIEGTGTKYNSVLFHDGKLKVVAPGAFDRSINDAKVEMWIDHDRALKLGDTRSNLELFSDEFGLHFRLRLNNTELSSHAQALVESKAYTECSVGFDSGKTELREIDGHSVLYILQARLEEVSIVPAGAVKATHAQISDIENCESLERDCKSLRFRSDNAYAELQRALRRVAS